MTPRFRAWDKKREKMCIVNRLTFMFESAGGVMAEVIEDVNRPAIDEFRRIIFPEDFILMQSTGLTDKNGTEIFEGDVLKLRPYATNGEKDYLRVVSYEKFHCDSPHAYSGRWQPFNQSFKECEVIGNCHQHPVPQDGRD